MGTFSAHSASPPPPSRTPAGSQASSRYASIAPRTTSAHGPPAWAAPRTRTHRSIPAPPTPAGASRLQCARHDVLLCRVDRAGEVFHPIRPRSRRHRLPPSSLHHFEGHPAKEEGIGLGEVLGRVTMQVFVRDHHTMIAAPVQCDVDGIPKGSHCVSVSPIKVRLEVFS